ncbi:uncharacterized protein K452DRAFT_248606 [Aplosporella prunicola CBS 121167]|uniref:DNA-directed RNA polymerase I subunit RPA49 n=1 Tax=Aplosporella prunicola CBS 121167 TaxID=1176127 RepID=A0A6A6BJG9_9PEZI|nr:uncharacterized protein K452DRAFT_248606 [Aplosporella prunicola CBS 121167]KAF2142957.1 hypothetical protein K452DRAFT_248606 [Aplosporella prunicola CBS 121167]
MAADKMEKKRKRNAERTDRPSKKVAIDAPAGVVKVSYLDDDDELGPVITVTPGLSAPSTAAFRAYKKPLSDKSKSTKILPYEVLLQSSNHPKLDFTAREELDGSADSLLKHYVGVFDPVTGQLQVMEAHKVVLRSTLRSETQEVQIEREQAAERQRQSNFNLRQELGMEFGTKKAKKALASITENAINPSKEGEDPVASAVLQSMANATSDMPTREALQAAVDEGKPRPRANLEATTPADVYTPESLIGLENMRLIEIKSWLDAAENREDVQTQSRFVAHRLMNIASQKDVKKVKVLKYILLLIDFMSALKPGRNGSKKLPQRDDLEKKTHTSGALLDSVRRRFADGNEMTKWHVDNLITHIAALALYVEGYEVDTFDLREDLRLDNKQIGQYFHEIGCRVGPPTEKQRENMRITKAEAVNHKIAKLRIPLDFPKQRALPAKRR